MSMPLSVQEVFDVMKAKGYAFFEEGRYNVNLIGVRAHERVTDAFDDQFHLIYKGDDHQWEHHVFPFTSDPGRPALVKPWKEQGTAILMPGQYRGVYKVDLHGGRYEAICQRNGPVRVYRDGNKDEYLDLEPGDIMQGLIEKGYFGINIHGARRKGVTPYVGVHSAGCQTLQDWDQFQFLMKIANKAKSVWGNSFTYTLLDEQDFWAIWEG